MPGKTTSQWDFGDRIDGPQARRVYSVSELTGKIRRLLEQHLGMVWVTGEVSNLHTHTSGHAYFTLKDGAAQLNCVLFRGEARQARQLLQDGRKVILQGELTVYEPRGQYQLRVIVVELEGVGALQLAFDKLRRQLQAEGLFASERKRPLPPYPQRIGLATSPTGAAIRDVLHVIRRRQPGLEIIVAPCRVQGEGAASEIAAAIDLLNQWSVASGAGLDLILVTRGGGSLEDLWAFNDEIVARAIFESALPVVSAVGHEIDFTISDFVADLRAATPSVAAEIITEGAQASRRFIAQAAQRFSLLARQRLAFGRDLLSGVARRLGRVHPRRVLRDRSQLLDDLQNRLTRSAHQGWRLKQIRCSTSLQGLVRVKPGERLGQQRQKIDELARGLAQRMRARLLDRQNRAVNLSQRLALLSPENVLARGYSITMEGATGRIVRRAKAVAPGQKLRTRLQDGEIDSVVER